jgi:1-acyl-sn-glycerol-3-phosphate acyltransferase
MVLNMNDFDKIKKEYLEFVHPFLKSLREYHQHEVVGMDNIPENGRILMAVNHSLATYDIALLGCAIYEERGRIARSLADRLFFRVPLLGELTNQLGAVEGNQRNAEMLLESEELVTVAPGGMREALRPSSERYQILWEKRTGFVKLALKTGTPIVVATCPKADDIYDVFSNPLTKWVYKNFKIPVVLARGVGFTPIPRPVKLVHFVSQPIVPPKPSEDTKEFAQQVEVLHKKVMKRARLLIGEAIAYRNK